MGLWWLSQHSLKSCRLELEDRSLERASLFPLFDDEGRTRMLMITAEEDGRIMLADWAPGLFVRDWAWRNRLRLRFADLRDASMWDEERFEDLWHFDPWWVLRDDRYHGHRAVPALQTTNIPGHDPTISGFGFDSSLGRASYVSRGSWRVGERPALQGEHAGGRRQAPSRRARAATQRCCGRVAAAAVLALHVTSDNDAFRRSVCVTGPLPRLAQLRCEARI